MTDDLPPLDDLPPDPPGDWSVEQAEAEQNRPPAKPAKVRQAPAPVDDAPPPIVDIVPTELPGVSVTYAVSTLRPMIGQVILELASVEAYPVATATPQERADLLELRALLDTLNSAVRIRLGAIDLAFKRGMEELGARELPIAGYAPVRYTPDEGEWIVKAEDLRARLADLRKYGLIEDDDLERAFKTVVTVTADNRVLNGLGKRGEAVQKAIEECRERREGRPMSGKLTLPKRRASSVADAPAQEG